MKCSLGISNVLEETSSLSHSIVFLYFSAWSSLVALVVKNPPANAGDAGLNPGLGRLPGEGNGNLSQYSCLENSYKDGQNKGQNGKDLTEAEEIKRWQEYTEELYKKGLNDPDNHDGVVTHLEPDILECEVSGPQEALL